MSGKILVDTNIWVYAHLENSADLLKQSYSLRNRYRYSCWDSLILAAAMESGCETIFTEDLQHGQVIKNVKIINPFL